MANTFYYQRGESAGTIADLSSVFGFTDQSVIFEDGTNLGQDNTHFSYDKTNTLLKLFGTYRSYGSAYANNKYIEIYKNPSGTQAVYNVNDSSTPNGHFFASNGNLSAGLLAIDTNGLYFGATEIQNPINVSANYTAGLTYSVIFCDATSGAFTVTLPAITAPTAGLHYYIIKTDSSANAVTIARSSTNTFIGTGTTSLTLGSQGSKANLIASSNGFWGVF